jgi:hypothetical protein
VDKETFVRALGAEGLPVGPTYLHVAARAEWYRARSVFGRPGLPWTCPLYKGDPDAAYPLPNAEAADATHFRMSIHENVGEQEVRDTLESLRKVENAYLA